MYGGEGNAQELKRGPPEGGYDTDRREGLSE